MTRRLDILVISPFLPRPDQASGDRRFFALMKMLASGHRVDLLARDRFSERSSYVQMYQGAGVRVLPEECHLGSVPLHRRYDLALFEYYYQVEKGAPGIRQMQPWCRILVDSVDVHFLRLEAGSAFGAYDPKATANEKQEELRAYRRADGVIVVSEEDRQALESMDGMPPLFLLPNVVPIRPRPARARGRKLLFVGGYGHAPNVDAAVWFVREIWPMVHQAMPEAQLTLAGAKATSEVLELGKAPGVEMVGFVPATEPYLDEAAVSIAPLRFGAGMKGKVCEAMASSVPVVTTTIGAQGLGLIDGQHALIADEPRAFADAVLRLLRAPDFAEQLGLAGQQQVAEICGPEAVRRRVNEMLESIQIPSRPLLAQAKWFVSAAAHRGKQGLKRLLETIGLLDSCRSFRRRLVSEPGKMGESS